jgi:ferritin-like metal-binding protein YciE
VGLSRRVYRPMLPAWNVPSTCLPIEQELAEQCWLLLLALGSGVDAGNECGRSVVPCPGSFNRSTIYISWRRKVKVNSLNDLYLEQLKDLYDAEQQLIKALPKMAKASSSAELRGAFEEHLEKTKEHARRIETIFEGMGEKARGQKCRAMEGLVKEGSEVIAEDMENAVKDAALIAAAQRVEHYEMAGYGCVRTYASLLGDTKAAALLEKTLEEEKEADEVLGGIAEEINVEMPRGQNRRAQSTGNRAGQRSKPAA